MQHLWHGPALRATPRRSLHSPGDGLHKAETLPPLTQHACPDLFRESKGQADLPASALKDQEAVVLSPNIFDGQSLLLDDLSCLYFVGGLSQQWSWGFSFTGDCFEPP